MICYGGYLVLLWTRLLSVWEDDILSLRGRSVEVGVP